MHSLLSFTELNEEYKQNNQMILDSDTKTSNEHVFLPVTLLVSRPLRYRQNLSYGYCLEVKREYYQNCSVLDCVTQCSQSVAHLYEQILQVKQIGFVTLGPLCCA